MTAQSHAFGGARRAFFVLAAACIPACEPLSCQGRASGPLSSVRSDDVPALAPRCPDGDFEGDVDITNRAELETLAGCNTIAGAVIIHDSTDIVDLSALAGLQRIENGYLLAIGNAALTSMNLPLLDNLDNGLAAIDNPSLTQIELPALSALEGDLTVRSNPRLTQLSFPAVRRVQTAQATIAGAAVVVSVGNVLLGDLPALTSLDGAFPLLQTIDGSFEVFGTGLRDFRGLETLEEIRNEGGAANARTKFRADKLNPGLVVGVDFDDRFDMVPASNTLLESFTGLRSLRTIAGDVVIGFNPALRDFSGLDDLTTIANGAAPASLYVFENDNLTSFLGLDGDGDGDGTDDGLQTITGSLFVGLYFDRFGQAIAGGNDRLANLDGLQQLSAIDAGSPGAGLPRGLVLAFNESFESLEGLDLLLTLAGDLVFVGSPRLQDLKGAPLLQSIGGSLVFGQLLRRDGQPFNPAEVVEEHKLKDSGFPADANGVLQPQVRDPKVRFDPAGGANGFEALTTIGGDLVIAFSDIASLQLTDPARASLTTIGGRVTLYGNAAPTSLAGLGTVADLGGLVVNFAVDASGGLLPFPSDDFTSFAGLGAEALGADGLHIGFDDNLDDAAFATLPPLTRVDGSVTLARASVRGSAGPRSLAALVIDTIGGDLVVGAIRNRDAAPIAAELDALTSLSLDNVTDVQGDVFVAFCSALADTAGALTRVGGTLEFTTLPGLLQVAGLDQLGSVGSLLLHDLDAVTTVTLPALATVAGNLELVDNPSLRSFDLAVDTVGGDARLVGLEDLLDVAGLANLRSVAGDLELIDCPALEATRGLDALETIGGDLRLRRLDAVTNEARAGGRQDLGFASLVQVGGLEITAMGDLEDLAGLQTLTRIGFDASGAAVGGGALRIESNPRLVTLFGLQGLTRVGRTLALVNNESLVSFGFDDDNQDRTADVDNGNGIPGEADDPDAVVESGFVAGFTELGAPGRDGDVRIGGATGVVELRDNPRLDQDAFVDAVVGNLVDFNGFLVLCGNEGSADDADDDPRTILRAVCPQGQDGISDLF